MQFKRVINECPLFCFHNDTVLSDKSGFTEQLIVVRVNVLGGTSTQFTDPLQRIDIQKPEGCICVV